MQMIDYKGWKCIRLANKQVELIVTRDVGPRIIRFGFIGESDIGNTNEAVIGAAVGAGLLNLLLGLITYRLLKSGWKVKS
mgnify:CR=1 FL=1